MDWSVAWRYIAVTQGYKRYRITHANATHQVKHGHHDELGREQLVMYIWFAGYDIVSYHVAGSAPREPQYDADSGTEGV